MTGLVLKHGINTHDEVTTLIIPPRKVPVDHFVGDWKKAAVGTIGALDSWLLANVPDPFICASWLVTSLPGLSALETAGINVRPSVKQRPEQFNLGVRRRIFCARLALMIRTAGFGYCSVFRNGNVSGHAGSVAKDCDGVETAEAAPVWHMQTFASPEAKVCIVFWVPFGHSAAVQPKTEELLYLLLWSADVLMRPTFRNLTDSYESWAYRNGLSRQLATLQQLRLLERDTKASGDRLYRLTEQGRLHALGGRDPEVQWSRHWDGRWRIVLFDVPMEQHVHRGRLRRYLRARGFGCLQGSVWITPNPVHGEREILTGGKINVESLVLLEARPCSGESDAEIAAGAWDFGAINSHYARHLKLLDQRPDGSLRDTAAAKALQRWAADERAAWHAAAEMDPLLPKCLLPPGYLGCRAWQRRIEVLHQAGQQLRTFRG